ncbi:RNA 3'-terminal phosphate cyclase [Perkinsela sp. CCAP 1560/4]|nr:RNA 3'-terminal phosphate cyclase [Perkinsela sp. CCAP 1560/4]|eukprot:KNH09787.1 RNA 3'-terminal phosphate cyclase [Perkinsela sp. CCAP 1560/4]
MNRKSSTKNVSQRLPSVETRNNTEHISGDSQFFRYEIIAALLGNKNLDIRLSDSLSPAQINFVRFIDRLTDGTHFEVSPDSRRLQMSPGVIIGGTFTHQCVPQRGVGYWIEAACILCPFAKKPSEISFAQCVTNRSGDVGYDIIRTVTLPIIKKFGIEGTVQLKKRCCMSRDLENLEEADGLVVFSLSNVRVLDEFQPVPAGFIKRVRGIAYGVRVAPDLCNQTATSTKGILLKLLPDVYILTDIDNKKASQEERKPPGAGYGLCLITESTTRGAAYSAEELAAPLESPEDLAMRCVNQLLKEIQIGGAIDRNHQAMCAFLMGLANDMPSRAFFGTELSAASRYLIEHILPNIFHVKFMKRSMISESESPHLEVTCIGARLVNSFKQSS